jgi:hypothetical protein
VSGGRRKDWVDSVTGWDGRPRRHWLVLALWAVLIAAAIVGARASGGETVDVFSIPGSQSEESIGELLGPANWWLPHWLDRILPRIEIE